ncbi:MAG: transglutaminase-like domain-containing protein [Candidatus Woesearchaeota archaeon]
MFSIILSLQSIAVLSSNSAVLDVSLSVPIDFVVENQGSLSRLNIDFAMVPINANNQKVLAQSYNVMPEDVGEGFAKFKITSAEDFDLVANYEIETSIASTKVFDKVSFPLNGLDPSYISFISKTDVYDINNDISALAASLAGGEDDLFKVVFNLANWVHENVEYDIETLNPESLPASWVFNNRRGVCTEYTSLFISLARSLGIPAREVSGFAFTESTLFERGWEFHSWAEVYFPGTGWVLFDPTYGQFGFVDAGHVRLGSSGEGSLVRNSFSWRGMGVDVIPGQTDLSVNVLSTKGGSDKSKLSVDVSVFEEVISRGSYNFLKVDLTNNNEFYVAETIRVSGVDGLSFLSDRKKAVVLAPFESKAVYFVFKADDNLKSNLIYTFPLRFYLNGELFSKSFTLKEGGSFIPEDAISIFLESDDLVISKEFSCKSDEVIILGSYLNISCISSVDSGYLCFGDVCEGIDSFNNNFSIKVFDSGLFSKPITLKNGDLKEVSFISFLVLDLANIDLSNVSYSKKLEPNDFGSINVSLLKSSSSVPNNVSLKIYHPHFSEVFFFDNLNTPARLNFEFPARNLRRGANEIIISAQFEDVIGRSFSNNATIDMYVEGLSLFDEVDFFFRGVYFWVVNLFRGVLFE